jgi:hypothetical protein
MRFREIAVYSADWDKPEATTATKAKSLRCADYIKEGAFHCRSMPAICVPANRVESKWIPHQRKASGPSTGCGRTWLDKDMQPLVLSES